MDNFNALLLHQTDDGVAPELTTLTPADLPEGDTLVNVELSSLNFKDGLSITGQGKIARQFPMIPGIDLIGTVAESDDPRLLAGTRVVINGNGLGEKHWGGYTQQARVHSGWCVVLPDGVSTEAAAAIGTAGFTAMLAVMALERNGTTPDSGPVLVTGATGGVGSIAVLLLAGLGYEVIASTGRGAQFGEYLGGLGAVEIVGRYTGPPQRPLNSRNWAAAIDNVGGDTLANILTEITHSGSVASVGNASGADFETTVFPFILRGVNLLGIDSNNAPLNLREAAWERLTLDLDLDRLAAITRVEPLSKAIDLADDIVNNRVHGRIVLDTSQ
jgi:acrylyl-CoA reductase (NADPH)